MIILQFVFIPAISYDGLNGEMPHYLGIGILGPLLITLSEVVEHLESSVSEGSPSLRADFMGL